VTDVFYNMMNHTFIYNTFVNLTKKERNKCWNTKSFMGGRFVYRPKDDNNFVFKMKGYNEGTLYNNHEYYATNGVLNQSKFYKPRTISNNVLHLS